ncbi:MAG: thioredoxin fold domain-containing protein [Gammaproteobacteria bacterium]|nr:thioredoxin fold domain-containing protein [Gammaproteobacteria bacterium]
MKIGLLTAVLSLIATPLIAAAPAATTAPPMAGDATAIARLAKQLGLPATDLRPSPIAGVYELRKDHQFGYVSADGRYLIQGDIFDLATSRDLTEARRRQDRLEALQAVGADSTLLFAPAPPLKTRWLITAFVDVDCPFCRKLHSQIAAFNAEGIAVRYAFFPRTGPDTDAYHKAEAVWCARDHKGAFDQAMQGKPIDIDTHCVNPVARDYRLGRDLGLQGTPMLILPDGEKIDGYVPPKALAAHLADGGQDPAGAGD